MKKALFVLMMLFIVVFFVVAVSSVGEADDCSPRLNGSLWSGIEAQQENKLDGWIGGEVYLPGLFSSSNLAMEARLDLNCYDTIDLNVTIGLRAIFPHFSAGTGIGTNLYDGKYCEKYNKSYNWLSIYFPHFFSRVYFDTTEKLNYGQISFVADVRTIPIGIATSYVYSLKPGGKYEELRGDTSLSLPYLCWIYSESKNGFDYRAYIGGRIASFFNPADFYRADWKGVLGGLRFITSDGELRFEIQVSEKSDQYIPQGHIEGKLIISGSFSF